MIFDVGIARVLQLKSNFYTFVTSTIPDDNLASADPTVQEKAVVAVHSFVGEYFKNVPDEKWDQVRKVPMTKVILRSNFLTLTINFDPIFL